MQKSISQILVTAAAALILSGCSYMPWHHDAPVVITTEPEIMTVKHEGMSKATENVAELRYQIESENLARQQGCDNSPIARLLEKGPGYETYTVPCGKAQMMVIRCDFSFCHANT